MSDVEIDVRIERLEMTHGEFSHWLRFDLQGRCWRPEGRAIDHAIGKLTQLFWLLGLQGETNLSGKPIAPMFFSPEFT